MTLPQFTLQFGKGYELHIPVSNELNRTQLAEALVTAGASLLLSQQAVTSLLSLDVPDAQQKVFNWAENNTVEAA